VFLLAPTAQIASHAGELEDAKEEVRNNPDDADAHYNLGLTYIILKDRGFAMEQYKILKKLDTELANKLFNEIYE
jgi:thioredoxin-like negative regulator of GroEL